MHIRRLSCREGVLDARGVTIVIDVFRAFTCEPLMYRYGAKRIIPEPDIGRCLELAGGRVLVGENNELPIEGFDLTNSPSLIMREGTALFGGKEVVHRTTSGVTGAATAMERSDRVFAASFANARATAGVVAACKPETVSIAAMGIRSEEPAPEDECCGDCLESLLTGAPYDHAASLERILPHETAQKFLRGDKPHLPREDPVVCLQRDLVDFALEIVREGEILVARKVYPG